ERSAYAQEELSELAKVRFEAWSNYANKNATILERAALLRIIVDAVPRQSCITRTEKVLKVTDEHEATKILLVAARLILARADAADRFLDPPPSRSSRG